MTREDVDYGPLEPLIGAWSGDKGEDKSPEPDGTETNIYSERIEFFPEGTVSNAEEQCLAILRYHQHVNRIRDNKDIHDQVGYWTWDSATGIITHSFAIPRGVCVVAGGNVSYPSEKITLSVSAKIDDEKWQIIQAPFMQARASTLAFNQVMQITGDSLTYHQTTLVDIYGRQFEHTDENRLTKEAS